MIPEIGCAAQKQLLPQRPLLPQPSPKLVKKNTRGLKSLVTQKTKNTASKKREEVEDCEEVEEKECGEEEEHQLIREKKGSERTIFTRFLKYQKTECGQLEI